MQHVKSIFSRGQYETIQKQSNDFTAEGEENTGIPHDPYQEPLASRHR
jgi:hypothetical protein